MAATMAKRTIAFVFFILISAVHASKRPSTAFVRQEQKPKHDTHNSLERISVSALTHARDATIKLTIDKTSLKSSGQWFELSWSGVPDPNYADWIAL